MSSLDPDMAVEINVGNREGFDTRRHLRNAFEQARERNYDDFLIVDVDAHHFEHKSHNQFFDYLEDPVLRKLAKSASDVGGGGSPFLFSGGRNQFNAGRLLRYISKEDTEGSLHHDVELAQKQRDAIGIDYQIIFPNSMLRLGLHPDPKIETAMAWAYTRWWTEEVLPQDSRIKTLVYLPFHDPDACMRMIETFAHTDGVVGFMITSTRYCAVHHDRYMGVYEALEALEMPVTFHAHFNQQERIFEGMDRFLSVHALGFVLNNLVHTTNLVIHGIPERFPDLKFVIMESGLAWVPFLMQRLDNEFEMRSNEAPLLTRRPSEYMTDNFYYTSQPLETGNLRALESTMDLVKADTQLMFASDYPHWDFNLPSTIYDLPFLEEESKRNILGRNALNVYPRLREAVMKDGLDHLI